MLTMQTTSTSNPTSGSGHFAPASPLSQLATPMLYARNTEIYGEGEETEYIYQVISGAVRAFLQPVKPGHRKPAIVRLEIRLARPAPLLDRLFVRRGRVRQRRRKYKRQKDGFSHYRHHYMREIGSAAHYLC